MNQTNKEKSISFSPKQSLYIVKGDAYCSVVVIAGAVEIRGELLMINKKYDISKHRDVLIGCLVPCSILVETSDRFHFLTENEYTSGIVDFVRRPCVERTLVVSPGTDMVETIAKYYERMKQGVEIVDLDRSSNFFTPVNTVGSSGGNIYMRRRRQGMDQLELIYKQLSTDLNLTKKPVIINCFCCKFDSSFPEFEYVLEKLHINRIVVFSNDRLYYTRKEKYPFLQFIKLKDQPRLDSEIQSEEKGRCLELDIKDIEGILRKERLAPLSCLPIGYKRLMNPYCIDKDTKSNLKDKELYGLCHSEEDILKKVSPISGLVRYNADESRFYLTYGVVPRKPLYLIQ